MKDERIDPKGISWNELEKIICTPEEIEDARRFSAKVGEQIKAREARKLRRGRTPANVAVRVKPSV
jgi:hypothetical protein